MTAEMNKLCNTIEKLIQSQKRSNYITILRELVGIGAISVEDFKEELTRIGKLEGYSMGFVKEVSDDNNY